MLEENLLNIATSIADAGGRAILVGGFVRDRLRGQPSKDVDFEVFGLPLDALEKVLARHGEVIAIGRAFGVLRIKGLDADFSLPRRDSKTGPGHRGFDVEIEPGLDFAAAARRRDLTINSIGWDPLSDEILDPFGGQADLEAGRLRATDPAHFGEDPLRALRAAQFAARLEMAPDEQLVELCATLNLGEVSPERVFDEFRKLLLKGTRPSAGMAFIQRARLLRFFPELEALVGVAQDQAWHPEGDVWVHTLMVLDEAARLRDNSVEDLTLMLGALCHDFGKPATTAFERGHWRSPGHDRAGVAPTRALLERWRAPHALTNRVCALVEHHLAPALFIKNEATAKGYRRLVRKLDAAGVSVDLLVRIAQADHFGRTTEDALARRFEAGETFRDKARSVLIDGEPPRDAVQGRHLLARGMTPGPAMGAVLTRCRSLQDETGWTDPGRILNQVLSEP